MTQALVITCKQSGMQANEQLLKEIASELELGLRVFVHRETWELISVPTEEDLDLGDPELWEGDLERLEAAAGDFILFEPMDSTEAFTVMEAFVGSVDDSGLKAQLESALRQSKPFARFYAIVNASGPYRDRWFAFKQHAALAWLRGKWQALLH
ncbi:MAG: hypothetical protein EOO11_05860 [Chitinophagaceae bacterium]|nr:MAG: hypothetical protein EOO11_05860 [Chitinophagaceae bacterium]